MNEHDGLEPTAPIPRIDVPGAYGGGAPLQSPAPNRPPLPALTFGNPFVYVLRRFLAFGIDMVVIGGVATMLMYSLIAINPFTGLPNNLEGGFDATLGMGIGIALVVTWLCEAIFGTTLGKLAFGLHVYAPKSRFVGIGRAFTRNVLRPVDAIVIGPVLAILPGHRRVGDLFGGTVVANSPLRAFSPVVGWLLVAGLCAVPFFVASGPVTVVAVGAAFVEFVPPLIARSTHGLALLFTQAGAHVGAIGGAPAAPSTAATALPTDAHAALPTDAHAGVPTDAPTSAPSSAVTSLPTETATAAPTDAATAVPTDAATSVPTDAASPAPTAAASALPTDAPTDLPLRTPAPITTS
jgi:uncharacterized RDD family membrane protein YckC